MAIFLFSTLAFESYFEPVAVYAFVGSWVLYKLTDAIIPLRVTEEQEHEGLDLSQHGEVAVSAELYENGNGHVPSVTEVLIAAGS